MIQVSAKTVDKMVKRHVLRPYRMSDRAPVFCRPDIVPLRRALPSERRVGIVTPVDDQVGESEPLLAGSELLDWLEVFLSLHHAPTRTSLTTEVAEGRSRRSRLFPDHQARSGLFNL